MENLPQTILNHNEALGDRFKLVIRNLRQTTFTCQTANLPGISQATIDLNNPLNKIVVNSTKLQYENLNIGFKVDEDLNNFKEIHEWLTGITAPQDFKQFENLQEDMNPFKRSGYVTSVDASLFSLTQHYMPNIEIVFVNLQPVSLSGLDFELTVDGIIKANASFAFDYYYIKQK